jgi:hypothetical protein
MNETPEVKSETANGINGTNGAPISDPTTAAPAAPAPATPTAPAESNKRGPTQPAKSAQKPKTTAPVPVPTTETPTVPITAPIATTGLRVRVKVWTDPTTKKRYLVPKADLDMKRGRVIAHAVADEGTKTITLTAVEWQTLPFYYFQEDGLAPHVVR